MSGEQRISRPYGDTVLEELVELQRPNDRVQCVYIHSECDAPQWVAVLFAGNCGAAGLTPDGPTKMPGNFLLRKAHYWTTNGCATAIVDAPSDYKDGMPDTFRLCLRHTQDMEAVVAELRSRFPSTTRVVFIGTSQGTVSIGGVLYHKPELADAYVLTSPITVNRECWSRLSGGASEDSARPVLVVSNKKDGCHASLFPGALELARTKKWCLLAVCGNNSVLGLKPCQGKTPHGFYGIEDQVLDQISGWLKDPNSVGVPAA